ncbi:MAG: hypothetical protein DSZ20_04135 [Candidatus Thioglobus sp.]|nr:MAG: hypothetical protein DSZ17_01825 [Candidatus Thioglobus sp.]RUM86065.1 MAG: hypothetical protein DSZ20_04135 [Candidatus Thioglobus sp.]
MAKQYSNQMVNRYSVINLFLALWLGFVSQASIAQNHNVQSKKMVTIAVQSFLGPSEANKKWYPTINFLNKKFDKYHFELLVIEAQNVSLLRELVATEKLDYVITQPATTAELQFLSDVIPVLTKKDKRGVSEFGSVIITSSENTKINSIQDLKGKSFAGANPLGLGGWILGYDYLLSQGVDLYIDASRLDFLGRQDNIVDAVIKRMVDAGVIRTGVLEKLSKNGKIRLSDIKVLDYKAGFPYILSTNLVPEWSFSATTKVDPILTNKIVEALRQVEFNPNKSHDLAKWGDVVDYQVIHQLLQKHRIGIYKDPVLVNLLKKYYQLLLIALVLLMISIWYIREKRLEKINRYKVELERLSRVSSVDQLLSEIAHEIAQPVTSIKIDAKVIEKLLKNTGSVSDDSITKVVKSLNRKTDHCVDVINNIRSFLTTKKITHEPVNINNRISNVLKLMNHELNVNKVKVVQASNDELPLVYMSTVELDQVLLNLCKNAISAMSDHKCKLKELTIFTTVDDDNVNIFVKDTGPGVVDDVNLFKLFKTNKLLNNTEGLGLGLSLSRSIIKSYDGDLVLGSSSSQGATFVIKLPYINEK